MRLHWLFAVGVLICASAFATKENASDAAGRVCQLTRAAGQPAAALPGDVLPQLHALPDGRSALVVTRSGWVLRVDLVQGGVTAQVRVGDSTHAATLSAPRPGMPSLLAVANDAPATLVVLDERLTPLQTLRLADKTGHVASAPLGIVTSASRQSFVLALRDLPELWEISYNPLAPEIGMGLVHDFQYREGQFVPGYLHPQRTVLDRPVLDFALVGDGHEVLTRHAPSAAKESLSAAAVQVTHLDLRRHVPAMAVPPWPAPADPVALPWVCKP